MIHFASGELNENRRLDLKDTVILGAGVAGLGAALAAGKERATVFEKKNHVGGNCSSLTIDGFTFDTGIHLSFGDNKVLRSIFDQTPYSTHVPMPYNYFNGIWIKHPVQSNLYPLPLDMKVSAIKDFVYRPSDIPIKNYADWLLSQYGEYLTRTFHNVYTRKYWRKEPREMTTDWIGNRMKQVDLEEILVGALSEKKEHEYYINEMRYPKRGGFAAFLEPLKGLTDVELEKEAVKIDSRKRTVVFSDGDQVGYEHLFCSVPMPEIVEMIEGTPEKVKSAVEALACTSVCLISVGFDLPDISEYLWFYVYDEDILFSRIYSPSIQAASNAPPNKSSLQMECYFSKESDSMLTQDVIRENAFYSMKKLGLPVDSILFADVRTLDYANVTFVHSTSEARKIVADYLESLGINLIGRYAEWRYLWSNQSFVSGYDKAFRAVNKYGS